MSRRRKKSSLDSRLVAYSAMAGAVLAAGQAGAADCGAGVQVGSVCYTDIADQTVDSGTIYIDFDGDGIHEMNLTAGWFVNQTGPYSFSYSWARVIGLGHADGPDDYATAVLEGFGTGKRGWSPYKPGALVQGDIVGEIGFGTWDNPPWILAWATSTGQDRYGNFEDRGQRFAGVRLVMDGSTTHYGWARVTVPFFLGSVTLHDFAFNLIPGGPCPTDLTSAIFDDGFESGDASAWSLSVGIP